MTVPLVPKVQRNQRERLTGPPAPKVVAAFGGGLCRRVV